MLPDINLLPKKERQSSFYFYLFIGLIIICLAFAGFTIFAHFQTKSQLKQVEEAQSTLSEKETTLQAEKTNLMQPTENTLEQEIERTEKHVFSTSVLINHLLASLPAHSYLSEYRYTFGTVQLKADFETMQDISTYTEDLLASPFVTNVKVQEVQAERLRDDGETGRATIEDINEYYEKTPRYEVEFSLQMNRPSIKAINETAAEALIKDIEESIGKGDGANE